MRKELTGLFQRDETPETRTATLLCRVVAVSDHLRESLGVSISSLKPSRPVAFLTLTTALTGSRPYAATSSAADESGRKLNAHVNLSMVAMRQPESRAHLAIEALGRVTSCPSRNTCNLGIWARSCVQPGSRKGGRRPRGSPLGTWQHSFLYNHFFESLGGRSTRLLSLCIQSSLTCSGRRSRVRSTRFYRTRPPTDAPFHALSYTSGIQADCLEVHRSRMGTSHRRSRSRDLGPALSVCSSHRRKAPLDMLNTRSELHRRGTAR